MQWSIIKIECNSDIHMLSVNREGQSVLELWLFEDLVNPYYGHLQVGNSARICDVIARGTLLIGNIHV